MKEDRESIIAAVIREFSHVPFSYGEADCARFAARLVDRLTGSCWEAELDYEDEASADAFIANQGGMEAAVTKRLGDPMPVDQAVRGDIVLATLEAANTNGEIVNSLPIVGVHGGSWLYMLTRYGLCRFPRARAIKAWKV